MSYIEGFVAAVPSANKDAYLKHAESAVPIFKGLGATRLVEGWGEDVPKGKVTDFYGAVKATDDETVVFSWIEYPDKATRDAANEKLMNDPAVTAGMTDMPFDGKRMIFAGFEPIMEKGNGGGTGYVQGFVIPVPSGNRDAYQKMASTAADVLKEYGASRVVEAWGTDVPDGKVTDYKGAVQAAADESIVFSFIEWPSKSVCDEATPKMMTDARMAPPEGGEMPFDGKRLIYGGFAPIVDR